jgi:hypothetical protein
MFQDVLEAGSAAVPGRTAVLDQWLSVLYRRSPQEASRFVKEAAELSDNIGIMEKYAKTAGRGEPVVYIDWCQLLAEQGAPIEKILEPAREGLMLSDAAARERAKLATLLVNASEKAGDQTMFAYGVLERFYAKCDFGSYLSVFKLGSKEANQKALVHLKASRERNSEDQYSRKDDCFIHLLNRHYDQVFDKIKSDQESLGWSYSPKGRLFPFFLGLGIGFAEGARMTRDLVIDSVYAPDETDVYAFFRQNIGPISREQEDRWRSWCIAEARKRADAIVSGGHRASYFKAARLLVALYEVSLYGKDIPEEQNTGNILREYYAKYPRHVAFKSELREAIQRAKLTVVL